MFKSDFQSDRVVVGRSAVRNLTAASADVEQSAVQRVTADSLVATRSLLGSANASTAEIKETMAGIVAGDYVRVENSQVFVLLAPRVSGNVHAVLTLPAAFAMGAGYYVARRIMIHLFGRGSR